jgi:SseB protein N-terminal domain
MAESTDPTERLAARMSAVHQGRIRPAELVGEFRRTPVVVPVVDGGLMTAELGGIRWIHAFTDEVALARFARARGQAEAEWEYTTVLGARLLDAVIPAMDSPGGVALDAGSPHGMLFPPVVGVVPEEVAVDAPREER